MCPDAQNLPRATCILKPTAASRTLEPNQVLILLAARPTGAQWLCPPL
jgi:hypothetical protein